ncbi:FAD-dependent oxidoreductase [Garicola koreensis]|uniref:Thioredoxin reductase n=1 Tax=Garicola koreensis TaxID=1262554 RepID=A0A7W5Y0H7_9MICC|nr:FAD-dependent oxidoreductase [Garicola koreensis]MBB3667253.1 thioredoxin reductase [Garicola koreensis]
MTQTDRGMVSDDELPVVVIGAGPVGLAAAAHLVETGLDPLVLEAGDIPAAAITEWGHIRLFSSWRHNVDAAAQRLLQAQGWKEPDPAGLPTGAEFVAHYLAPLAAVPELVGRIRTGEQVIGISRGQRDKTHAQARSEAPFIVRVQSAQGLVDYRARAIIDASGTWGHPNPVGAAGLPALGEDDPEVASTLLGGLPDVLSERRREVTGKHVLVLGGGHSAVNTLLNLVALQREAPETTITWAIRGDSPEATYGGGDADGLLERGALGQRLREAVEAGRITLVPSATVHSLALTEAGQVAVTFDDGRRLSPDFLAAATGFRPDLEVFRELRVDLDPGVEAPSRLAPLIDPQFHSCGTVEAHGAETLAHPEEGFFIAGMKSYGRAPTFLLATGYEQVRSIAAHLAGQDATVRPLNLPETGVCSAAEPAQTQAPDDAGAGGGCCSAESQPVTLGVPTGLVHGRGGA